MMYQPIQSARLYEQVVQQIEARILNHELEPGDKLPSELELADQFGVSRTVIREATKVLRAKELVEVQLGRGTFITGSASQILHSSFDQVMRTSNEDCVSDLNELREILEPQITALAVERAGDVDIEVMQSAIQTMEISIDDAASFIAADLSFHHALANATKNPLTSQLISPILNLLREQLIRSFIDQGERKYAHQREMRITQHKRILDAIIRRDPQAAIDAMHDHLEAVRPNQD
jgi:GntR family transcriptional repressor for pyruvate dehydrogenase complex